MNSFRPDLNAIFHALADPTRRAILLRLGRGNASVSELARPHEMALPSFMKHLDVLQESGLITSKKAGRVRTCEVVPRTLTQAEAWMSEQRELWQGRTDRLAEYVENPNSEDLLK